MPPTGFEPMGGIVVNVVEKPIYVMVYNTLNSKSYALVVTATALLQAE